MSALTVSGQHAGYILIISAAIQEAFATAALVAFVVVNNLSVGR